MGGIKRTGEPSREPRFFYVRRFEINISIYRGQPRFDSIITGETHERSVKAYRREVPDTPVKITQLPSSRKLPSCTRKCLRQKSDGTICRLSKSRIPASGRGEDRNTFVNAVEAIIILYQNERNKIKILLRLKRMYAIMMASIKSTGGSYAAIP